MNRWRGATAWGIVMLTLGLILFGTWIIVSTIGRPHTTVTIAGMAIKASVARTTTELDRGLSGVDALSPGTGMLFVFPSDAHHPMWMKDMKINLDIVWLSDAKKVVHIEHDLEPNSYPRTYDATTKSRYVLEIPAGSADKGSITIGTTASFDAP